MIGSRKKYPPPEGGKEGALRAAASLLAYKENTESELKRKLLDRGYDPADIDAAFAVLREKRYLDEKRYFFRFVENCALSRRFGPRRILMEAKIKGFSEKTVSENREEALSGFDFDELCLQTAARLPGNDAKKKAAALLRRGYGAESVRYALSGPDGDQSTIK